MKKESGKIEDPQELQRKLEEVDAQQKKFAMVNEANKEEIYRINFNKVVRKQLLEPKKKDEADRKGFSLIGKSTDRGGDDSDDPNLSKMSDESGSSEGGSSEFLSERSGEQETKKGKTPGGKGKGGKPSDLMSGRDNATKGKGGSEKKEATQVVRNT